MNIKDFFVAIGHGLAKTFGIIKKVVPEEYLVKGIELAKDAAEKFVDNADKRQFVVTGLKAVFPGMPDSVANLVVEIAVQHLKHDAIEKGADAAKTAVEKPE